MKTMICGYSGAGKSTLGDLLAQMDHASCLHLDAIHFLPGWAERPYDESRDMVRAVLEQDSWVIDGNYFDLCWQERAEQADRILFLNFPRMICLWRAYRRYLQNRGRTRSDMAAGCIEKFDSAFFRWVLWEGRARRRRARLWNLVNGYSSKTIVLSSPRAVKRFLCGYTKNHPFDA